MPEAAAFATRLLTNSYTHFISRFRISRPTTGYKLGFYIVGFTTSEQIRTMASLILRNTMQSIERSILLSSSPSTTMNNPTGGDRQPSSASSSSSAVAASAGPTTDSTSPTPSRKKDMPNNTNDANIANSNRGDIRMKRACEARIADPSLTLLEALKIGGFVFPQDQPTCEDCDVDGVRLRQRKNQLSVSEAFVSYGEAPQ